MFGNAVQLAAATPVSTGATSGAVSIVIGVVIIIGTVVWTIIHRRANKTPAETTPPPPVRRLGADVDWWRANARTGHPSGEPPAGSATAPDSKPAGSDPVP